MQKTWVSSNPGQKSEIRNQQIKKGSGLLIMLPGILPASCFSEVSCPLTSDSGYHR